MTTPAAQQDAFAELGTELARHARILHMVKTSMSGAVPHGLEGAAVGLLMQLVRCGPRRQGEIAGVAMLDPSTVSRYVGQLVRRGLVERRPDPADGRAVQLVATAAGHATADDLVARRNQLFRRALSGWHEDDLRTLHRLLARLNDDFETNRDLIGPERTSAPSVTEPVTTASAAGSPGAAHEEN